MYKLIILFVFTALFTVLLNAQTTTWKGTVLDENSTPAPYANVLLLEPSDSTFIKGAISNLDGNFEVQYNKAGNYLIRINMIGYESEYLEVSNEGGNIQLETIKLTVAINTLEGVEVTAKKPLFEQKIDRTVVNVQNSAVNAGNSALAILSRSPAVIVDRGNDQINLMGNDGVVIMINNKLVRMETAELITMLDGMSADNIQDIELITSPSASYDVQGSAGIININLVKNEEEGLNGNLTLNAGYGLQSKYGASTNLSIRKNKIYAYANLSSNNNNSIDVFDEIQKLQLGTNTVTNDNHINRDFFVGLHTGEVGLDYDLNEKNVLGASFSAQYRFWDMIADGIFHKTDDTGLMILLNENLEQNKLLRSVTNLNYRHTSAQDAVLSLDYDFISFERSNPTTYNVIKQREGMENLMEYSESKSRTPLIINVASLNYNKKLTERFSWESGLKWTYSQFENAVSLSDQVNGEFVSNPLFTDDFDMDEKIYAGYLSTNWKPNEALEFKLGSRYEYYQINLQSINEGNILTRERGRIYPNFFVSYAPSENLQYNFSYVERVERPSFLTLAPAFYFINEFALFTGNSSIIPSISKRVKFDVRFKTVNASLLFSRNENPVFQSQFELQEDINLLVVKPLQANLGNTVALSVTVPFNVTKFWNSRLNINANYLDQAPVIKGIEFPSKTYNYNAIFTNTFNLIKNYELELNGQYYSKLKFGVADVQARWGIDFGISKKFESGSRLSFNITDIFDTSSGWKVQTNTEKVNLINTGHYNVEGSVFRLSYAMPFGNQNIQKRNKRYSGSQEEQNRLN